MLPPWFEIGLRVKIIKGKYRGYEGIITGTALNTRTHLTEITIRIYHPRTNQDELVFIKPENLEHPNPLRDLILDAAEYYRE
jgi:hypothetical protein